MNWKGAKVLVTGAGGFIGSHLCEVLLERGATVRGMIHGNMRGRIGYLAAIPEEHRDRLFICHGNMRDGGFVRECAAGTDFVYHLAAITSVKYSYSNPDETILTNVMGTLNVCNACRFEGVERLIHTSSAGVYGSSDDGPIRESHPVRAHNPYTASKLAADTVVESYHLSYDLPVTTCRIFNVYGPRVSRFLVVPTIILQLLDSNSLRLGDLTPTRNFTYVDDIIDAFIRMAESEAVVGEVVNFGHPHAVTIGELALLIGRVMKKDVYIEADASRLRPKKSEIQRVTVDNTKAATLLGWSPTVDLEEGLRRTIDWIKGGGYDTYA
jgi:dTDP-glucose 4,6-dehydratase